MKEFTVPSLCAWEDVTALPVDCFPWPGYSENIRTSVKVMRSETALLLRFETDERPLLAEKAVDHSPVCEDSCMEFFFRTENTNQYINLEINPLGTVYADFDHKPIAADAKYLHLVSTITPERWILQYEVPFSLIETYLGPVGDCLYANFYKCGDKTEHPHYACWNPVGGDVPNFHQPQSFGKLILQ